MHIREVGFLQLVGGEAPHRPLVWFDRRNQSQPDLPWPEEWNAFRSQVRRFSDHDFFLVLGHLPAADDLKHWIDHDLPNDYLKWTQNDYLLIGEFLRRNHGRLAHEIAIFGFPGVQSSTFPALQEILPNLADIVGAVARSHSLPLREAADYFSYKHPKELRPRDTAPLYLMALLRVGDYLQLDSVRAPRILFRLRSPKSPSSVDAWNQHGAVAHISYVLDDPVAIKIELDANHSLSTHLQLEYLIDDLQKEIDISSAVLSENYGRVFESGLQNFRLAKLRVLSNHRDQALRDRLPYVPEAISLGADPRIISLMVEPIYGLFPEFGVRELLQNAVDAVLERRQFLLNRHIPTESTQFEVVIELVEHPQQGLVITFTDQGIGMSSDVVRDFFLRAGASFRDSRRWRQEFVDARGHSQIRRSGRFGVGVFAGFLLGDSMDVKTRHVTSETGMSFSATIGSDLVELRKIEMEVGTSISIQLSRRTSSWFEKIWPRCTDWYGLANPRVVFKKQAAGNAQLLRQIISVTDLQLQGCVPDWNAFTPEGFASVSWTNSTASHHVYRESYQEKKVPRIYCNGFLIGAPVAIGDENRSGHRTSDEEVERLRPAIYPWDEDIPFKAPTIMISDNEGAFPLTLRKDQLVEPLPFKNALVEDIILDFIAWCIANAPVGPLWDTKNALSYSTRYPLVRQAGRRLASTFDWVCSNTGVLPLDRSLLLQLKSKAILVSGTAHTGRGRVESSRSNTWDDEDRKRDRDDVKTTIPVVLKEEWSNSNLVLPSNVLAVSLPEMSDRYEFGMQVDPASNENLHRAMIEVLVAYLRQMRETPEFVVSGALIMRQGADNSLEQIRAGDHIDTLVNLTDVIGPITKRTAYYAWGDERRQQEEGGPGSRFVAELAVEAREGTGALAEAWMSVIGAPEIPFDERHREEVVEKASAFARVGGRIEKWRKLNSVMRRPATEKESTMLTPD